MRTSAPFIFCLGLGLVLAGCARTPPSAIGDTKAGVALIGQAQCGACHVIPGIAAADGMSGPPLTGVARRTVIAGTLANTPANMIAWVRDPQTISPGNAMPAANLTEQQARNVVAYLETLR